MAKSRITILPHPDHNRYLAVRGIPGFDEYKVNVTYREESNVRSGLAMDDYVVPLLRESSNMRDQLQRFVDLVNQFQTTEGGQVSLHQASILLTMRDLAKEATQTIEATLQRI